MVDTAPNPPTALAGDPIAAGIVCRKCRRSLDASDAYCRHCDAPANAPAAPAGPSLRPGAEWWESPWVVLPLLFVILGPLALPMLWRSRRFTRTWQIVLSVVVVAIAVYTVWYVWDSLRQSFAPLFDAEKSLGL